MGYVHYIRHPRGPLYPIDSEKFDNAGRCSSIDLPTSSWVKAESFTYLTINVLAEGSCRYDTDIKSRTLKFQNSHNLTCRFPRNTEFTTWLKRRRPLEFLNQAPPVDFDAVGDCWLKRLALVLFLLTVPVCFCCARDSSSSRSPRIS